MKRTIGGLSGLVVTLALALAIGACGGSDTDDEAAGGAGGNDEAGVYKIGYFASLSGRLALYEQPLVEGLKLRIEQINAEGGIDGKHKIELTVQDAKSEAAQSAVVAGELIDQGAQFLVGPCDSDDGLPGFLAAQEAEIPVISSCAGDSHFQTKVGDFAFLNAPGYLAEAGVVAEFAAKNRGLQTAYVLLSNDLAYLQGLAGAFETAFTHHGGEIVETDSYKLQAPTFRPQVTRIVNMNPQPEAIYFGGFPPDSVAFLKDLRAAGYDGPVMMPFGNVQDILFKAGDAVENVILGSTEDAVDGSRLDQFYDEFEGKDLGPRQITVSEGADIADLIAAAVTQAGTTDPKAVRDAFAELEDVEVTSGTVTYKGHNGNQKKDFYIVIPDLATKTFKVETQMFPSFIPEK